MENNDNIQGLYLIENRQIIPDVNGNITNLGNLNKNKQNKFYFTYVFKESLGRVYDFFNKLNNYKKECFNKFFSNVSFSRSEKLDEEGNLFNFDWKNNHKIQTMCIKQTKTSISKSFTHKTISVSQLPYGNFLLKFKFFYNSCENYTLFTFEIEFDNPIEMDNSNNQIEVLNNDFEFICKEIELILHRDINGLEQTESVIIKNKLKNVWNFIIDFEYCFNSFYKPLNGIKLSMENDKGEKVKSLQVGTLIKLIKDDIVISNLVIKKINENDDKSEIFMDSSENKKFSNDCIILEQTCYIMCKKLKENATFLMVKHIGHEFVSDEKLNALSVIKKKILLNYKNILEKNFNSNLKSNDDSINLNISSSNSI